MHPQRYTSPVPTRPHFKPLHISAQPVRHECMRAARELKQRCPTAPRSRVAVPGCIACRLPSRQVPGRSGPFGPIKPSRCNPPTHLLAQEPEFVIMTRSPVLPSRTRHLRTQRRRTRSKRATAREVQYPQARECLPWREPDIEPLQLRARARVVQQRRTRVGVGVCM